MDISVPIAILLYVVLIIWGIFWGIKNFRGRRKLSSAPPEGENIIRNKRPIFRAIAHYLWPIWFTVFLGFSSFIIAANQLHKYELIELLGATLFMLGPLSLFLIFLIYLLCRLTAYLRKETLLSSSHAMKMYVFGILISLVTYVMFQERNPLRKYGVEFEWEDPPGGATGSYYIVYIYRTINGQTFRGPVCGGIYPRITFSDEDGNGIQDIIVHTGSTERGVFAVVDPYVTEKSAFKIIRGTMADVGCWYGG